MKDNRLHESLYLFVYTILLLSVLSLLPSFSLGTLVLKDFDLLSDIRFTKPEPPPVADTITPKPELEVTRRNANCPPGIICLEDFSADGKGLEPFFRHLEERKSKPVRIAFYGDSFIEGDILTSGFRDTLQQIYGGKGLGFVPLYSEVAKFRTTIKHEFENLVQKSIIGKYSTEPTFGADGMVVRAEEENWITYKPGKNLKKLEKASLLYSSAGPSKANVTLNDTTAFEISIEQQIELSRLTIAPGGAESIRIQFTAADSVNLYGMVFESENGIYVDNLAMRGNSGLALTRISTSMLSASKKIRPYHLIVLQFGLNVVAEQDSTDYTWYVAGMRRVIEHFKNVFPESSILLLGISDRSYNQVGEFTTLPGVLRMRAAQRKIAQKTGVLFWDTFEAMGGENSMVKLAAMQPPLAGKDHTHLNARGGKMLSGKLAKALLFEISQYERSAAH